VGGFVMDGMFSFGALAIVVAVLVIMVTFQQFQQNRQYREIQDRLREMRQAERLEQMAHNLRTERSTVLDPITILEATLQSSGRALLTPEELAQVENARARVKTINETLAGNRQWMGAPFDLYWLEFLDRIPIVRKAYLAANYSETTAPAGTEATANHASVPAPPTKPSGSFT